MNGITTLQVYVFYFMLIVISVYLIRRKMNDKDYVFDLFLIGIFGWMIAFFLEVIPFQFLTDIALYKFGVNIRHLEQIKSSTPNFGILLIASLIIGFLEEFIRYECFKLFKSMDKSMSRHRIKTSLFIGMGWASAEIIVLTSFSFINGASIEVTFLNLIFGIYTRILSYIFHISLSFIVFFASFDKSIKNRSLGLAIIFNTLINFIFVIWVFLFDGISRRTYIISQQIVVGITVSSILIFTLRYWIPHFEPKLDNISTP